MLSTKRLFIVIGCIFCMLMILNHIVGRKIIDIEATSKKATHEIAVKPEKAIVKTQEPKPKRYRHELVPSNPEDYGMVVLDRTNAPRTPEQWELHLKSTMEQRKILEGEQAKKALEVAKTRPEDHQKQMKDLDDHIDLYREKLQENPLDQKTGDQLQNLYKLKAIGNILEEKVVTSEASPAAIINQQFAAPK